VKLYIDVMFKLASMLPENVQQCYFSLNLLVPCIEWMLDLYSESICSAIREPIVTLPFQYWKEKRSAARNAKPERDSPFATVIQHQEEMRVVRYRSQDNNASGTYARSTVASASPSASPSAWSCSLRNDRKNKEERKRKGKKNKKK
jgi:hypothetical protein